MIERFGQKGTDTSGIFFTEGLIEGATRLGEVKVESRRQNTNLLELKSEIANKVKFLGGNALENFTYVQQGTFFSFSSTRWRVSGTAVRAQDS